MVVHVQISLTDLDIVRLSVLFLVNPSVSPSVSQSVRPSVSQSVSQLVSPSVRPSVSQSVSQSVNQWAGQSTSQSVSLSLSWFTLTASFFYDTVIFPFFSSFEKQVYTCSCLIYILPYMLSRYGILLGGVAEAEEHDIHTSSNEREFHSFPEDKRKCHKWGTRLQAVLS